MSYLYIGSNKVTPVIGGERYTNQRLYREVEEVELKSYTIYTAETLTSLLLTYSQNIDPTFIAQLNFISGETPTDILPNEIEWFGDNVNESLGFKPRANCEYSVIFYYTGTKLRGVVQGSSIL